jgi:metal-responsive CopG/Arc/MetJ family transcriptional regulator
MHRRPTTAHLPLELLEALDTAARRDLRSRSKQLERYVREGLARDGVDVPPPPSPET